MNGVTQVLGRGKRAMAWVILAGWFAATWITFGAVIEGGLSESELRTLDGVYWIFTGGALLLIIPLLGLDATAAQIIPALKQGRDT